jgi:phosphoglycerate dehydrogenase-like enzyme
MAPTLGDDMSYVAEVDPRIAVLDGADALAAELHDEDPSRPAAAGAPSRAERDRLLAQADVLVVGYPVPRRIAERAPRLRWAHHVQAGVSNLHRSDLWSSEVLLTSGRGSVATRAIAEYVIAAALYFARGLHEGDRQRQAGSFVRHGYRMRSVHSQTMGIIGFGGIGQEVGQLAQALGMRVLATRRSIAVPEHGVLGADLLLPADRLVEVAAQCDHLAVCSQLTTETRGMIDRTVLAAMQPTSVLINVARGEEVDEDALIDALVERRIAGAVLDVHQGELDGTPPRPELLESPLVLLTPHVSGLGDREAGEPARRLVAENLRRFLDGRPLRNAVDRQRGY